MGENIVLRTVDVRKQFDGLVAVDGVSVYLRDGETVGVIGPNGAGKTTLFNLLTGLYHPDSGKVLYYEQDITNLSSHHRVRLGIVRTFQLVSVLDSLTVLQNIMLARIRLDKGYKLKNFFLKDMLDSNQVNICMELLHAIGLDRNPNVKTSELPYGKKRELEIAMGLAMEPRVLLLDEPLAGMSVVEIEEVTTLIQRLRGRITILLVEHKVSSILDVIDRLYVMHEGRIVCEGEPTRVISDPVVRECYFGKGISRCFSS